VKYLGDDNRIMLKGIFSKCGKIGKYKNYPCTDLNKPLRVQEVQAPKICRLSVYEGKKFVTSTHRPPLPSRKYPWYSFLLQAEPTPGT